MDTTKVKASRDFAFSGENTARIAGVIVGTPATDKENLAIRFVMGVPDTNIITKTICEKKGKPIPFSGMYTVEICAETTHPHQLEEGDIVAVEGEMELHADTPFNPLSMRICTLAIHAYSEFFGTNIWLPLTWKGRAIEGFLTGNPVCQACGGKEMTEECSWLGCSIAPLGKPTGSTECSECGNPICDGLCPRCDRHSLGCDYSKPYGNGGHLCSTCAEDELRRYNLDCAADKAAEAMDKVPYDEPVFVKYSPRGFANEWDILAFSSHAQYSFFVRGLDPAKSNWTELSRKQAEDMLANAEVHWAEERDGLCTTTLYGGNLIVQP